MSNQIFFLVLLLLIIWITGLTFYLYRLFSHYQRLSQGVHKGNLIVVLNELIESLKTQKEDLDLMSKKIAILEKDGLGHIQKVGITRFNPFKDSGGEQSFIFAILDGKNNGAIVTSLNNRGVVRWYAKNIIGGKGENIELTEEEEKAIARAKKEDVLI